MTSFLVGVVLISSQALLGAQATPLTLYVAPDGKDSWSGTLPRPKADGRDGPLASLAGARDAIRRFRASTPEAARRAVRVVIAAGTYWLQEAFVLKPAIQARRKHQWCTRQPQGHGPCLAAVRR